MNSQIKKLLLFVMAVCVGLAAVPARSFAFGEAGTFYVQPEFGVYGTGQKQVNSIISFGASGGYFVMDGLALGVEGLAYSFDQKKEGSSSYNRSEFQQNPWAFGFNGLVRYYPIRTDMASFFIGSGLGGMFSNDRIPYYTNGGRGNYSSMTLPADIGVTFNLTQTVGLELVGRYQRIGFDDHGLDSWGGHAGVKISF